MKEEGVALLCLFADPACPHLLPSLALQVRMSTPTKSEDGDDTHCPFYPLSRDLSNVGRDI